MISYLDAIKTLTASGRYYELQEIQASGKPCKWYVNGPLNLAQLFTDSVSDETFFVYGDERYTFREMYSRAASLAVRLQQNYNVEKGDCVAIAMRNYPEWVIAFTAITSVGAIAVAMNAWWETEELEYGLRHTGSKIVFADQERLERLSRSSLLTELQLVSVRSDVLHGATEFEELIEDVESMPVVDIDSDDDAVILFTSGSTGRPKGSVSSHRNIIASLLTWELELEAHVLIYGDERDSDQATEIQNSTLLAMPLFHVNGLLAILLSSYRRQRKTVSMYKWDTTEAARLIEHEKIVTFIGTPAMTGDLTEEGKRTSRDLTSLRVVGGGGAPRAPSQVLSIDETFEYAAPNSAWGMTETNSLGTGIFGQDYLQRMNSSGRSHAVIELAVIDENSNYLPANERGELLVRGTSIIRGYWNRPDANEESFIDGWFRTGDVAYIDEDGFLYIVDRLKQLIIRGGENIGCGEVEAALLSFPQVTEASAYGVPDERLGEEVGATIYSTNEINLDDLNKHLEAQLAKFKIPVHILFVRQPLARIASGKIDKRTIRAAHLVELGLEG